MNNAFTHFPTLTTNRLHLRQLRPTDAEALFALRSDQAVMEFFGQEPHQSLADTHKLIQRLQASYERQDSIFWCVTFKGEDAVIGTCTLFSFNLDFHYAETGYELSPAYWRQGITIEAMSAVLTYGFTELGLHRIEADVAPANVRSKNLLLKLGFTFEGNLRQRYFFRGQFEDEHYYGLLKDEWLQDVQKGGGSRAGG